MKGDGTSSVKSMDAPEYIFRDNVDVEDFLRISSMNSYSFKINMQQFNDIQAMKLPYVFEGSNLRRINADDSVKNGFW